MNFVISTMTSTTPVSDPPTALMVWRAAHPAARRPGRVSVRSCRFQCRTMPVWLSVNETNTPTM